MNLKNVIRLVEPSLTLVIIACLAIIIIILSFVDFILIKHQLVNQPSRDEITASVQKGVLAGQVIVSGKVTLNDTTCSSSKMTITPVGNPDGYSDFPVQADGSFLATMLPAKSVLLIAQNSSHQACLEAIAFPAENDNSVTIDDGSTALSLVYTAGSHTSSDVPKLTVLPSFVSLKDYLSKNLNKKNMGEISSDSQYKTLFDAFNKDAQSALK